MENSVLPTTADILDIFQSSNQHYGIIMCVDDPLCKGRVLVECSTVYDVGAGNWTGWTQYCGIPTGSNQRQGDMGLWIPPVPGMLVLLGFEGGNEQKPYCIPAGAWAANGKPYIPTDAANLGKNALKCSVWKSQAGHTVCMNDTGAAEGMYICDWTGAGSFSMAPGKTVDATPDGP